jgi:hypothetical protein
MVRYGQIAACKSVEGEKVGDAVFPNQQPIEPVIQVPGPANILYSMSKRYSGIAAIVDHRMRQLFALSR